MPMPFTGRLPAAAPISACVLFNADGEIRHRHEVVDFPGATPQPPADVEAHARRLATQLGHDVSALQALHVPADNYRSECHYKVDTGGRRLVEVPPAA